MSEVPRERPQATFSDAGQGTRGPRPWRVVVFVLIALLLALVMLVGLVLAMRR